MEHLHREPQQLHESKVGATRGSTRLQSTVAVVVSPELTLGWVASLPEVAHESEKISAGGLYLFGLEECRRH